MSPAAVVPRTGPVLLVHLASTLDMFGLVWFVQVVHYPLLGNVGGVRFAEYEDVQTRRTGWVVGPAMAAEALTAAVLLWDRPTSIPVVWVWVGLGLLAGRRR